MSIDLTFPATATVAGDFSPETAKKYFAVLKNIVRLAKGLALLTKTTDDDEVIAGIETALAFIEPYLGEAWAYELLNSVLALFKSGDPKKVAEAVFAALQVAK